MGVHIDIARSVAKHTRTHAPTRPPAHTQKGDCCGGVLMTTQQPHQAHSTNAHRIRQTCHGLTHSSAALLTLVSQRQRLISALCRSCDMLHVKHIETHLIYLLNSLVQTGHAIKFPMLEITFPHPLRSELLNKR